MRELPIACALSPAELKARRAVLLPGLLAQAEERTALPDGFRWRFVASSELLTAIAQTIDAERQCCRFLRFILTVEPDGGAIWLDVTACNRNGSGLQSTRFRDHIKCIYRPAQDHIKCH
jgi:hypothetical protein